MSNVIHIGRSRKRLGLAAWCTYAAIILREVPQTRRENQIVDDNRESDLAIVKDAFARICELSDEAIAELREDYERRLGMRAKPTSKYFTSAADIVGKVG